MMRDGEMSLFNRLLLRGKRSNSPFARFLKRALFRWYHPALPPLPRVLMPGLRFLYHLHFFTILVFRWILTVFYRNPLFQSKCASFGRGVFIGGLPFVTGPVEIHMGDRSELGEDISILSGRIFERPQLILKEHAGVGMNTIIVVNREVVIEEHVVISWDCRISDSDGHPREADLRAAGKPPDAKDIRPVRIGRYAWIGNGSYIMKGVTIGEGAIIGANSVVISNIPPYSLAMGNPAEVILRNFGLPTTARKKPPAP
jgi:carbonic anhydrase/acetyltransferase-like protein (isoleucine patch superfamily)